MPLLNDTIVPSLAAQMVELGSHQTIIASGEPMRRFGNSRFSYADLNALK